MTGPQRVAIIGAGHVGATAAYGLMLRALFTEIVLIDSNAALAAAEAADLSDANALARPARIWAGSYADAADAAIAVITAGAATHGAEPRLSVTGRSATIVAGCVDQLISAGFAGVIVVAANPVDLMSLLTFRRAGLPAGRVIGTGALLDTMRLRRNLAARLAVAAGSIDGFVLGEHGDSEVAAFSTVQIAGLPLEQYIPRDSPLDLGQVAREVRDEGYRVVSGKGYTSFGIATAIVRICEAVLRDEQAVLAVSTLLTGQYGLSNLYLSMPCVIGASGVERVVAPDLTPSERTGLAASAQALRDAAGLMAGLSQAKSPWAAAETMG